MEIQSRMKSLVERKAYRYLVCLNRFLQRGFLEYVGYVQKGNCSLIIDLITFCDVVVRILQFQVVAIKV